MNYKMIGRFISLILSVEAVFMLPALVISIVNGEGNAVFGFLTALALIIPAAALLYMLCRKASGGFYAREGLVCVSISWIVMSLFGCLPFWFSGEINSFIDAFFEIVSGFTTTGASILPEVESLSKGILYWRSFSHWLGGMGVLVFLLAIAPSAEKSEGFTMHIMRAESPGPNVGKLVPRMKKTAAILYILYVVLTVVNIIFLLFGGMPLFDAVCTAFGTAGTGGFGTRNDSIAGFNPYIQNVCTVFMLLFGINFGCYHLIIMWQFKSVLLDEELRLYAGIFVGSTAMITLNLCLNNVYGTVGETVRHSAFQVSSIMTTTGFATTDFDLWPSFSKAILLLLMFTGACAGSTGGGMKCARLLLLIKNLRRNIHRIIHPQRIQAVRVNGRTVSERVLDNTNSYLAAYVLIVVASFLIISLDGFSITTNFSAVLACFNNIGPGLEAVGPVCNYSGYSPLSKIVLIADMLAGRLEIFPMMILLFRSTWTKK